MKRQIAAAVFAAGLLGFQAGAGNAAEPKDVLKTYADIAHAGYEDSLITAKALKEAIAALVDSPSEETLTAAREAWLAARVPYQQTEAYRFGNAIVDEWEGKVNAWPLDEGLIDYVDTSYGMESDANPYYAVNVIANETIEIGGETIDATEITPAFLQSLHELGGVEANVSTGYHAIEFLLWGQDLHGTDAGAGERPYTDYDTANCTGGHCDRRAAYLTSAADLLITDLEEMVANWAEGGKARTGLLDGDPDAGLQTVMTGLGSLSYGELAGERMKLGLLLHDPEEEHDCFSDNTHNSHYYDELGIRNVYLGSYTRIDGSEVKGAGISELVAAKSPEADKALRGKLDATVAAMEALRKRAEGGEAYDQMIGEGNEDGNTAVQAAIDALLEQTQAIEQAVSALDLGGIAFEGSDSLDSPDKVFE
ncbi:peptidase [Kaustia mangrovi]|uniref:Peptidase n=1 Tax=Kaustia mangrovi TaxID=2593653 RepID=A0A7S8C0W6_9HYPH|nr:imelysin family protein [Kaustia mangrovi]QPC41306.1 peptidase [Kaustia mangrovi]